MEKQDYDSQISKKNCFFHSHVPWPLMSKVLRIVTENTPIYSIRFRKTDENQFQVNVSSFHYYQLEMLQNDLRG